MTMKNERKLRWKAAWSATRAHWAYMKRYGSWDGRSQWLEQFNKKPDWEIRIIGKSGKVLRTIKRGNITHEDTLRFIRMDIAAFWATIKKSLKVGQTATITLNNTITKHYEHSTAATR